MKKKNKSREFYYVDQAVKYSTTQADYQIPLQKILFLILSLSSIVINVICLATNLIYMAEQLVIINEDPFTMVAIIMTILLFLQILFLISFFIFMKQWKLKMIYRIIYLGVSFLFFAFSVIFPFAIQFKSTEALIFYRNKFLDQIKLYEDNPTEYYTVWLNNIQRHYRCCGYKNNFDYSQTIKPSSCCDDSIANTTILNRCLYSSADVNEKPNYYLKGCNHFVNQTINKYSFILFLVGVVDLFLMIGVISLILVVLKRFKQNTSKIVIKFSSLLQRNENETKEMEPNWNFLHD